MTPTREELLAQIAETEKGRIDGINAFQAAHHRLDELRAKLAALDAEPDPWDDAAVREALCDAAMTFEHYAELHAAKNTAEGNLKAERNRKMAAQMREALAALPLAPAPLPMGEDEVRRLARQCALKEPRS